MARGGAPLRFDAAVTISAFAWLDPQPKKTRVNQMQIMIWLDKQGAIQPIGNPVGNVSIEEKNMAGVVGLFVGSGVSGIKCSYDELAHRRGRRRQWR